MTDKAQINLLFGLFLGFVLFVVMFVFGSKIVGDVDNTFSYKSSSQNVTTKPNDVMASFSKTFPLIAIFVIGAILIMLLKYVGGVF